MEYDSSNWDKSPAGQTLADVIRRNREAKKKEASKPVWDIIMMLIGMITSIVGIFVVTFAYGVWANGYVGHILWAWFVSPIFGLPDMTLAQACGLSIFIHFWTYQHYAWKGKDERTSGEMWAEVVGIFLMPWVTLFTGWIVHRFFM